MAPTIAITQRLMPVRMRAVSSAVILLSFNIVGIAFGNLITGVLSDALAALHGNESIRYALAWTQISALIGLVLMIYATRRTPEYIKAAELASAH
jgi:MFS family permease